MPPLNNLETPLSEKDRSAANLSAHAHRSDDEPHAGSGGSVAYAMPIRMCDFLNDGSSPGEANR